MIEPSRDLTEAELWQLVGELAARPDEWRHLVAHDADRRRYVELLRDHRVSVWLICWSDEQDTGFHDHDLSSGAVAVVAGSVREDRLALGGRRAPGSPAQATASRSRRPTSTA